MDWDFTFNGVDMKFVGFEKDMRVFDRNLNG